MRAGCDTPRFGVRPQGYRVFPPRRCGRVRRRARTPRLGPYRQQSGHVHVAAFSLTRCCGRVRSRPWGRSYQTPRSSSQEPLSCCQCMRCRPVTAGHPAVLYV